MKRCPFCAERIQSAAVRCKHCASDLPADPAPVPAGPAQEGRGTRRVLAGLVAIAALVLAGPVIARPLLRHLRSCEPSNWLEWHAAMQKQCLQPAYVCDNMTTGKLMQDPDVARSFHSDAGETSYLSELVGRMRSHYGCAPEQRERFHSGPAPLRAPGFPIDQDRPRSL